MSYCRFSCDDWSSDVYCYVSGEGYTTHVAARRVLGTVPPTPPFPDPPPESDDWIARYLTAHNAQMAFLETAERVPIGLQYDGETFDDADLPDFLDRLLLLRAVGYHVPEHALAAVREELAEASSDDSD